MNYILIIVLFVFAVDLYGKHRKQQMELQWLWKEITALRQNQIDNKDEEDTAAEKRAQSEQANPEGIAASSADSGRDEDKPQSGAQSPAAPAPHTSGLHTPHSTSGGGISGNYLPPAYRGGERWDGTPYAYSRVSQAGGHGRSDGRGSDEGGGKPVSAEAWIGRNLIGIAASLLIFAGLIFLGVFAYDYLTDFLKMTIMFSISLIITLLGVFFNSKRSNAFTLALTGCGTGSMFISIMLTHLYFDFIGDITAFTLLAVWLAGTLYLAKRVNSISISVIAHIGMIFSICFAYGAVLNDEKLAIVLIYQAVSTAVILLGNIICFRRTYRFGLIASLLLSVTASFFMTARFTGYSAGVINDAFDATALSDAFITSAFALQFLCASFLSYLLAVSSSRLKNSESMLWIHAINKILWTVSLFINITSAVYRMVSCHAGFIEYRGYLSTLAAVTLSFLLILAHGCLSIAMKNRLNFERRLSQMSVIFMAFTAMGMLLSLWISGLFNDIDLNLPGFIVVGFLLLLAGKYDKTRAYRGLSLSFFILDMVFMCISGYSDLEDIGTIMLPLLYMTIYVATLAVLWLRKDAEERGRTSMLYRIFGFAAVELSLVSIILNASFNHKTPILLITLTTLAAVLYFIDYDRTQGGGGSALSVLMKINEGFLVVFAAVSIAFFDGGMVDQILCYVLAITTSCLAFARLNRVFRRQSGIYEEIAAGIKLTILVLAIIRGNTSWFDETYVFSLVCMVIATLCIVTGFIIRGKALRLYGLIFTLVCVLKLVTVDVANLNTILRVVAFIGGGVMCFIISAIYSYSNKKLLDTDNVGKSE